VVSAVGATEAALLFECHRIASASLFRLISRDRIPRDGQAIAIDFEIAWYLAWELLQFGASPRVGAGNPLPHRRQHIRQKRLHLFSRHSGPNAGIIENVEKVLIVKIEEAHLDIVIEHGPGHRAIVIDGTQRLQQLFIGAIDEAEFTVVSGEYNFGASDAMLGVFAEAGQAFRRQPLLDLLRQAGPIERADGALEIAIPHENYDHVCGAAVIGQRNIEMVDVLADVGHHRRNEVTAIGLRAIVDKDPDRRLEFADAVGASSDAEFGPECDLEEPVDDLVIGKTGSFGTRRPQPAPARRRARPPPRRSQRAPQR
jgi:hypothetical protein